MRIEICGGIASGKTTLARLFAGGPFEVREESFHENPFWKAFYSDPAKFGFETEITFLLQHFHQMRIPSECQAVIHDCSLMLDMAYAKVNLFGDKLTAFDTVLSVVRSELGPPDLLIYLSCDPETELARIRERAREEETSISLDYLARLNNELSKAVHCASYRDMFEIDSAEIDFRPGKAHDELIFQQIIERLSE